ncbi:MAG: aspartate aminotransferase family protein [Campylobacteraceae bacterium]|nr:aspartate aminotransferase family protein [Campylobacteraceae bacterium]
MNIREKMTKEFKDKSIFKQVQDYSLSYLDEVGKRDVYPASEALQNLENFSEELPQKSMEAKDVLEFLNTNGAKATVDHLGGKYFGFVTGGVIPASLAARVLSDFWDQNSALYVMSPIASKLEEVCESWLKELFGLPKRTVAGFVSGSSIAIFCGLAAGRYRVFKNNDWDINKQGFQGAPKIRIVAGKQAHGTVIKAVSLLGFGTDNIEWVDHDSQGRLLVSKLPKLDKNTIVVLQAGNVCSGAFDDFESICTQAKEVGAWVHIDGAFGLWAAASKKLKYLTKGMEKANSFSVDGHKTLNTPYDNGIVLCDDEEALTHALHSSGSYIVHNENRDGMFYTPEMSKRARSIELWAAMKYLGRDGIEELINGFYERATELAYELEKESFEIVNDVVFNQIMIRYKSDDLTNKIMKYIQESGTCWLGGATWKGQNVIRISICSWVTTEEDVLVTAKIFKEALTCVDSKNKI